MHFHPNSLTLVFSILALIVSSCGGSERPGATVKKVGADGKVTEQESGSMQLELKFLLNCKYPYRFETAGVFANVPPQASYSGNIGCQGVDPMTGATADWYVEPHPSGAWNCSPSPSCSCTIDTSYMPSQLYFQCTSKTSAIQYNCVPSKSLEIPVSLDLQLVDKLSDLKAQSLTIADLGYFEIEIPKTTGYTCATTVTTQGQKIAEWDTVFESGLKSVDNCLQIEWASDAIDVNSGKVLPYTYYGSSSITYRIRAVNNCL